MSGGLRVQLEHQERTVAAVSKPARMEMIVRTAKGSTSVKPTRMRHWRRRKMSVLIVASSAEIIEHAVPRLVLNGLLTVTPVKSEDREGCPLVR